MYAETSQFLLYNVENEIENLKSLYVNILCE